MKKLVYLIFLCLIFSCASEPAKKAIPEKYFQGAITYDYDYTTATHNLGYIKSIRPKKGTFSYDLENYQSTFVGADTIRYYYSSKFNKAISSKNNAFEVLCEDYSVNPDSLISYKVYDTDEVIQGQTCKVIEIQSASSFNRYHVSKEVFLAPDTYQKHIAYNWALYGEQANGGIILRVEHRFQEFTMYGEASSIVWYKQGEKAWNISEKAFQAACR